MTQSGEIDATYYMSRKDYEKLPVDQSKRLKVKPENTQSQTVVADLSIGGDILKHRYPLGKGS